MGRKFNPPPGWPVHYGFEPPPGWQPDPDWPPAPPGWPLWIGSDAPRAALGGSAGGGYVTGYPRPPQWSTQSAWPPGYHPPAGYFPPPQTSRRPRTVRSMVIVVTVVAFITIGGAVKAAIDAAHRSPTTGRIVKKGHLEVFSLRTGDCFQSRPFSALARGVAGVRAVPDRAQRPGLRAIQGGGPGGLPGPQRSDQAGQPWLREEARGDRQVEAAAVGTHRHHLPQLRRLARGSPQDQLHRPRHPPWPEGLVAAAWRGSQTAPLAPRNPDRVGLTGRSRLEGLLCR